MALTLGAKHFTYVKMNTFVYIEGRMVGVYTVALVGFSEHESSTIASFLRRMAYRPPAYQVQDDVMHAQRLVVNADNVQALYLVRHARLPGRVLLLGSHDGGTGWPLQRKPVKLMGVLALLDSLVYADKKARPRQPTGLAPGHAAAEIPRGAPGKSLDTHRRAASSGRHPVSTPLAPVRPARARSAESGFTSTRPMQGSDKSAASVRPPAAVVPPTDPAAPREACALALTAMRRPGVLRLSDWGGLEEQPLPVVSAPAARSGRALRPIPSQPGSGMACLPDGPRGDLLLVAQSMVEGRLLYKRLQRYGLSIDWSLEAAQAQEMLKGHAYRLVVIDRLNKAADAHQVCRSAKQCCLPNGQAPVVLMFAPTAGTMDRVRARLAGCDAYLSPTVDETDLYKVLAQQQLLNLGDFEETRMSF